MIWSEVQKNAFDYISEKGLPTKLSEDWKYTSLKKLGDITLVNQKKSAATVVHPSVAQWFEDSEKETLEADATYSIIFIDGILVQWPELSGVRIIPTEKVLRSPQLLKQVSSRIRKLRKKTSALRQDSVEALNTAFAHAGVLVIIDQETALERPIEILHFMSQKNTPLITKNWVFVSARSKVELFERFVGFENTGAAYTSSVTEIILGKYASCAYNRLQKEDKHLGLTRVYSQKGSAFQSVVLTSDSELSRHQLDVHLIEEEASANLYATSIAQGTNHLDHATLIDHAVGHCQSDQLYKNILADQARVVFNGKVLIQKDAQKASSTQLNNNLLLSSQAEADSKPQLQIYADDVKATHGSTIGQLSTEEVFYFESRGISKARAERLLCEGFAAEVAHKIENQTIRNIFLAEINKSIQTIQNLAGNS